jgi:two-component system response regulator DctR
MSEHVFDVLIVEDDPMVADLHKRFISTLEGFTPVGVAGKGTDALAILEQTDVDLVLLDIFMPGIDGLDLLRKIRAKGKNIDVIMITAGQEGAMIQEALRLGVFDYLLKPFEFERLKAALQKFRNHRLDMGSRKTSLDQGQIDALFSRRVDFNEIPQMLPKGIQENTLKKVLQVLESAREPLSVFEIAQLTGFSRVTVKRYVQFLLQSGRLSEETHYQEVGRPLCKYTFIK